MITGLPVRKTVRASGYLAMLGVLLCAIVGTVLVTGPQGLTAPYAGNVHPAGTVADTKGSRYVIWGAGDELDPQKVTCTKTSYNGSTITLPLGEGVPRETTTVPARGAGSAMEMTSLLANVFGVDVQCSGGGLEHFALSRYESGPPKWVIGIGFFVFGGVAALWSLLTLTLTRERRRADV